MVIRPGMPTSWKVAHRYQVELHSEALARRDDLHLAALEGPLLRGEDPFGTHQQINDHHATSDDDGDAEHQEDTEVLSNHSEPLSAPIAGTHRPPARTDNHARLGVLQPRDTWPPASKGPSNDAENPGETPGREAQHSWRNAGGTVATGLRGVKQNNPGVCSNSWS